MSKKIPIMRDEDINIVNDNISTIIEKARKKEINIIEPTIEEFMGIKKIILDFVRKEKRIIYGGYGWNSLITKVSPKDAFYKDTDYADVEFYSNKPIEDVIKLCNILHDKGYKFVQGKNAQHDETYTIFVNFQGYCDITYMPSNIFYSVMTETINGLKIIHPKFIMVDILRQFNDPMTSYWRLDKNIRRGKIMMKHYPLEFNTSPVVINQLSKGSSDILENLIPSLSKLDSIIFTGTTAYNAYMNPQKSISKQTSKYESNLLEIISTNQQKDVKLIYNNILKYFMEQNKGDSFNDKILMEQYYPFFQFTDKKVIFKYEGQTFLIIYGNNEKCIPYNEITLTSKNNIYPIKITTFNVTFMYMLIKYHQAYSEKDRNIQNLQDYLMSQMLTSRDTFLNEQKKNVLDETIFEDFKVNCLGEPVSPMRKFMMARRDRKLMPRSAIPPYDPEEHDRDFPFESYFFQNASGNVINNPRDLVFNLKKDKD